LGGSEYYYMKGFLGANVPGVDAEKAGGLYQAVANATDRGLCHSLHTPAIGGLAAAFARMCIGGRLGLRIDLEKIPRDSDLSLPQLLFSESNSRFIATVPTDHKDAFETCLDGFPFELVGEVVDNKILHLHTSNTIIDLTIENMLDAFSSGLK